MVIWNMAPVLREEDEKNENIPKLLCQMDNHLGMTSWFICILILSFTNYSLKKVLNDSSFKFMELNVACT